MGKAAIFLAEGFEEIEALAVVDICRRCEVCIDMVSIMEDTLVKGSHGIGVKADMLYEQADVDTYDMLILPGGMPGTKRLEAFEPLMEQMEAFYEKGRYIAAICAAPSIFGHRGYLKGRKACSYPTFESHLEGAVISAGPVEISDHVITSRGMGTAIDFGLAIAGLLSTRRKAEEMADTIVYQQ